MSNLTSSEDVFRDNLEMSLDNDMIDLIVRFNESGRKEYHPSIHDFESSLAQIHLDIQKRPYKYSYKNFETINRMVKQMNRDNVPPANPKEYI